MKKYKMTNNDPQITTKKTKDRAIFSVYLVFWIFMLRPQDSQNIFKILGTNTFYTVSILKQVLF
jgi:hypothetical protein